MSRIRKAAILLGFLSLAVAIMSADGFGHCASMTSFEGRVVDADTLEPIEGALVVAIWMEWKGRRYALQATVQGCPGVPD